MATVSAVSDGVWSDNSVWDAGHPPQDGDKAVISGHDVELDTTAIIGDGYRSTTVSEANARLVIKNNGRLAFSRTVDSYLGVKGLIWVNPAGSGKYAILDMGTDESPIPESINAVLQTNEEKSVHYGYYWAARLQYYNSSTPAEWYAQSARYRRRNTHLVGPFDAGSTQITVDDATGWKAGDTLILAPRYTSPHGGYKVREFETAVIQSVSGNDITLSQGLTFDHGYSEERLHKFAILSNLTSNVRIMGPDDSHPHYVVDQYRAKVILKNVEFGYANNVYNYHTAAIRSPYSGYYGDFIVEHIAIWMNTLGISRHQQDFIFGYTSVNNNGHAWSVDDIAMASLGIKDGYRAYRSASFYYGGRATDPRRLYGYGPVGTGNIYKVYGIQSYQQPAIFEDSAIAGAQYGFTLHNNVGTKAINSLSIGCPYGTQSYNGTAEFIDHSYFMVDYLSRPFSQWSAQVDIVRPRYADGEVNYERLIAQASFTEPTDYTYYDIQNNPKRQMTGTAGGILYRDIDVKATSVASVKVRPDDSSHGPLVIKKDWYVADGDTITVEAQMRKDSSLGSIPRIRLKCSQFDVTQDMTDTNDTWVAVQITSPTLNGGERVTVSLEFDHSSSGRAWVDDVKVNGDVWDIGQMLWGKFGTETSTVIDVTDKNRYITLTDLHPGSNVDVYLGTPADSGNATLLDSVHNLSGSEWTFGHQHQGGDAYLVIQHIDYVPQTIAMQLPNARSTTIPVRQQKDRVYNNP